MKTKRKPLSKKTRFEVFKRDSFICQYCGAVPPTVVLEVDHIKPVSKGGDNSVDNLITACFDCNRGKSNNELKTIPDSIKNKHKVLTEKNDQLKEYQKLIRKYEKRIYVQCIEISEEYTNWFPEFQLTQRFIDGSVKMFIEKIGYLNVKESMSKACARVEDEQQAIKYFCGICWNIIKGDVHE